MAKKKTVSLSNLEKKLDSVFSIYIRKRDADEGGTVQCVTCKRLFHWKEVDAGHFIKRQHRSVRWDERNVYPQCRRCNHFMGGRMDDAGYHVIKLHGLEVYEELMRLKYQAFKVTRSWLLEQIEIYKRKIGELENVD